jgi:diguanylate cyclase (GGDEF)-like protein
MFDKLNLKTAVWVYDIDNFCITWANQAGLDWWCSPSIDALRARNLESGTSAAVGATLKKFQHCFFEGQSFTELWHFSPKGIEKKAFCMFSGVRLDDGRMAMLCEAIPINAISPIFSEQAITIIAGFNANGEFESCNPPFNSEFGTSKPSLQNLLTDSAQLKSLLNLVGKTEHFETDLLLKTLTGNTWFRVLVTPSINQQSDDSLLLHFYNIDNRKKRELALIEQAQTDILTGLLNRRGFDAAVNPMIEQGIPMYLFGIDLDGFKLINDSLGHGAGDDVLQEVATRLKVITNKLATVCRFGGDEFLIAVPDPKNQVNAHSLAANIVKQLSKPYVDRADNLLVISASVGVSMYPENAQDLKELIRFADAAMFSSKKMGKQRWTFYSKGMEQSILRKSKVAQYLRDAIKNEELSLHYQPIVNTHNNTIDSFEALLRWSNAELGQVPPPELIAVAEAIGIITEIENWVIKTAISDLSCLRQYSQNQAKIAVNISSVHIVDPKLIDFCLVTLSDCALLPEDLVLEITETNLLDGLDKTNNPMSKLSESGILLSIDDFGTGYSSLAYLNTIKATSVKIDRAFIQTAGESALTIKAIYNLVRSLNMTAIIEGIETTKHSKIAKGAGIQIHQGYFYARPKPLTYYIENKTDKDLFKG